MSSGGYNKRTRNEIETIVNSLGYLLLDEYMNAHRKVVVEDVYGYRYDVYLDSLTDKRNKELNFVHKSNPYTLENISLWLKNNNKDCELCEGNVYIGCHNNNLKFYCFVCKEYFYMSWENIFHDIPCAVCGGKQIGNYNNLEYINPKLSKEWIDSENGLFPRDVTEFSTEKVLWECTLCKHQWWAFVYKRSSGRGCSKCADQQIESKIATQLKEYILQNYKAETEYKIFKNPKTNRYLPFDIYIYDNIFIEIHGIHGIQHYYYTSYYHKNQDEFEYSQYKDQIKKRVC